MFETLDCYPLCIPWVEGIGLEVGGPSAVFGALGCLPVYGMAERVDNCVFAAVTAWGHVGDEFLFNRRKAPGRQFIGEASELPCDGPYDFVLASHCLEHSANPLKCLGEFFRVLREDGLLVLLVPAREASFDWRRPVTTFEHLVGDLDKGEDDLSHLEEILALHDLSLDAGIDGEEAFRERSLRNVENRCLHHHVFDGPLALEAVESAGFRVVALETGGPHIVVLGVK